MFRRISSTSRNIRIVSRTGCTRLDVVESGPANEYVSFWFAHGVGLVQYTKKAYGGIVLTWTLQHAKVKSLSGIVYEIGKN